MACGRVVNFLNLAGPVGGEHETVIRIGLIFSKSQLLIFAGPAGTFLVRAQVYSRILQGILGNAKNK